ncbi:MAG: Phospholipase/carboxylesterase [Hyphomicrobiales bacterium]|nr:Phospholipase/carboxylesterase [Hyphomicrobiales bacterium]
MRVSGFRVRAILAVAFVLAAGIFAVPRTAEAAYGRVSLTVGGLKRTATLVEFERLKKRRRPVIIVLHGGAGGSGAGLRARRSLGLDAFARNTGAVVVYPDAVDGYWGRAKPGQPAPDDAGFVRALASKLIDQGIASRRHIYIAGISGGGMLAMKIACDNSDLFAGVGAIIANLPAEWAASCTPTKPLAFMLINGTADPMIPYGGGPANMPEGTRDVLSTEATVAVFSKAAECTGQRSQVVSDRDKQDGSKVTIEHGTGCKAPVELVRVDGGGHTIPGRRSTSTRGAVVGAQNNDIDGARMMWDFLLKRSGG